MGKEKIRIALVVSGGRGAGNVARERAKLLTVSDKFIVDWFDLKIEYKKFQLKDLFKKDCYISSEQINHYTFHKIEYSSNNHFINKCLSIFYKYSKTRICDWKWQEKLGCYLGNYDILSAHFNDAALICLGAKRKFKIPYCVTWHGSDIHSAPFFDSDCKIKTIEAIENANCNFFVSNFLKETSDKLTTHGAKVVLYNGYDKNIFYKYSIEQCYNLRQQYNVANSKVVSFCGTLRSIKNVELLPEIFELVSKYYCKNLSFWVIGDGPLRNKVETDMSSKKLDCKFWGTVEKENVARLFNCTDILLLPSQNEGLPLVVIEALSCGANVIGSNAGGIVEAVGEDFCVPLGENFVENIAKRIAQLLDNPEPQEINPDFDWEKISKKEIRVYDSIIQTRPKS